jgi:hypothetical protein
MIVDYFKDFFTISIDHLNLFSIVLGAIWGLSTSMWKRYHQWWWVVGYFVIVSLYFANEAGAFNHMFNQLNSFIGGK